MKGLALAFDFQKGDGISYSMLWYNQSLAQTCLLIGSVSQVSNVDHGPFVK